MKCLLLLIASFFSLHLLAQEIPVVRVQDALQRAKESGKLLFIQFDSEKCGQCNDVADKGLSGEQVSTALQSFVSIKINASHPDRAEIGKRYNMGSGFGALIVDQDLTLINSLKRSSTDAKLYLDFIDASSQKVGEALNISTLEKEYKRGNRSPGFMEMLLVKRRGLQLSYDMLFTEYVRSLPLDSFQSKRTLAFMVGFAPVVGSYPDSMLRKNKALFNDVWYAMPLAERTSINTAIISKSINAAIHLKKESYAHKVATFARNTHLPDHEAGAKSYAYNMMRFYKAIGDTAQYFDKAVAYYNTFYLKIPDEQITKEDSAYSKQMLRAAMKEGKVKKEPIGNAQKWTVTMSFISKKQYFALDLEKGARAIYELTSNPYLLSEATKWMEKGLQHYVFPDGLEIQAKLLYQQGQTQKAIETIEKAIKMESKRGFSVTDLTQTKEKMQKGLSLK